MNLVMMMNGNNIVVEGAHVRHKSSLNSLYFLSFFLSIKKVARYQLIFKADRMEQFQNCLPTSVT